MCVIRYNFCKAHYSIKNTLFTYAKVNHVYCSICEQALKLTVYQLYFLLQESSIMDFILPYMITFCMQNILVSKKKTYKMLKCFGY